MNWMQQVVNVVQTVCVSIISSDFVYIYIEFYTSALVICVFEVMAPHLMVEWNNMDACGKWHMYVACDMQTGDGLMLCKCKPWCMNIWQLNTGFMRFWTSFCAYFGSCVHNCKHMQHEIDFKEQIYVLLY
jgi:hypothetical protein